MATPQPQAKKLAKKIGLESALYLKREDLHPYGSHKGRSIPLMIKKYQQSGWKNFCISSSGNAALAAAMYINEYNRRHSDRDLPLGVSSTSSAKASLGMTKKLNLKIFVGKNIDEKKLGLLKKNTNKNIVLEKTTNPKQSAFQMDKKGLVKNLRQSTDDTALIGYEALAAELAKIKNLKAVFIPTSSGTTAQGLYSEFIKLKLNPQIHIIQTPACHPIVENYSQTGSSIAAAIVDKVAHRKEKVLQAIKSSQGNAWVCNNLEIKNAIKMTKQTEKINISPNSALSVCGLIQALKNGWKFSGPVVCLITGR